MIALNAYSQPRPRLSDFFDVHFSEYDTLLEKDYPIGKVKGISFLKIENISPVITKYKRVSHIIIKASPHAKWDSIVNVLLCFPNLKYLTIHASSLNVFPSSLSQLKKLEYLYIDYNNLHELTDDFCKLKNLKMLVVGLPGHSRTGNFISDLPHCFCGIKSLKYLYASFNKFEKIPDVIYCLKKLKYLEMESRGESDEKMQQKIEQFNLKRKWPQ